MHFSNATMSQAAQHANNPRTQSRHSDHIIPDDNNHHINSMWSFHPSPRSDSRHYYYQRPSTSRSSSYTNN